jgi:hypothetical protein
MTTVNPVFKAAFLTFIVVFTMVFLTNCNDEDNIVNVPPEEVAGTFDFTNYEFIPNASAIQPANVLDTLVAANTNLRLFDGGQFILSYQFVDGPESVLIGDFTVTETEIRLVIGSGNTNRKASLLLHSPLEFTRSANTNKLTLSSSQTVDLSAFSNRYEGIPPVAGRLEIELERRTN